jgi:hypothetical protein
MLRILLALAQEFGDGLGWHGLLSKMYLIPNGWMHNTWELRSIWGAAATLAWDEEALAPWRPVLSIEMGDVSCFESLASC